MNTLSDFPANQFHFLGACDACDHTDWLDRDKLSEEIAIEALRDRVTCQGCGSRDCGIRIVYVGAGEYGYGGGED
jgi:hypothetical protein